MASWTPELQKRYRRYKSLLTRRRNRQDWQGVIQLWEDMQRDFDIWPDDWHRWRNAADDARIQIQRGIRS